MTTSHKYQELKTCLLNLTKEFVDYIQSTWARAWSEQTPKVGIHFNYWDLKALPSYERTTAELWKVPSISEKYSEATLEKPLGAFLELIVGSLPDPSYLKRVFEYWWQPFLKFVEATHVPIQLFVGLSNFKAERAEYRLNQENAICFYGNGSLLSALGRSVKAPFPEPFPTSGLPMHMISGAIEINFSLPADQNTLEYGHYSHECINRMLPLENALRLSSFGRLVVGPWIPVCNPTFPIDGVRAIRSPEQGSRFNEPVFRLDDNSWQRFQEIYDHLKRMQNEDDKNVEEGRAVRRRFTSAISRFIDTFEQGYWESVVVDLVILMESLLTPNKQGGRMQLALAASNLLGTNSQEARELFDNVTAMYKLRNANVHGEPMTQETWDSRILEIARGAGFSATTLESGMREYAFELMRDYARRSIVAMLNLYYGANRPPSEMLTSDIHKIHLDSTLRASIHSAARCYSLSARPSPPS